jgi:aspartyl-tRNA(Asn)/glutamyl-tRNA(Gln) amidotransferase subunit C
VKITDDEVMHVASLARLDLHADDVKMFAEQIGKILEYVRTLDSVNTDGVESVIHAISLSNAFRDDDEKEHVSSDTALSNAPEKEDGFFIVPKIIE